MTLALGAAVLAWITAPVLPLAGFVAPALLLASLLSFWDPVWAFVRRSLSRYRWLEPLLVCCIIAIATRYTFGFLLTEGRILDTKDHAVMLPRTKELVDGDFQNWTHFLQGGAALFDLYPFTPAVPIWLLRAISPLSFEQCYSLVVVSAWAVRGVGMIPASTKPTAKKLKALKKIAGMIMALPLGRRKS